jgi:hypothetical protein
MMLTGCAIISTVYRADVLCNNALYQRVPDIFNATGNVTQNVILSVVFAQESSVLNLLRWRSYLQTVLQRI